MPFGFQGANGAWRSYGILALTAQKSSQVSTHDAGSSMLTRSEPYTASGGFALQLAGVTFLPPGLPFSIAHWRVTQ